MSFHIARRRGRDCACSWNFLCAAWSTKVRAGDCIELLGVAASCARTHTQLPIRRDKLPVCARLLEKIVQVANDISSSYSQRARYCQTLSNSSPSAPLSRTCFFSSLACSFLSDANCAGCVIGEPFADLAERAPLEEPTQSVVCVDRGGCILIIEQQCEYRSLFVSRCRIRANVAYRVNSNASVVSTFACSPPWGPCECSLVPRSC